MIPQVPNRFRDGATLTTTVVNENRKKRAADIDRSLAQRYSHSTLIYPIDGVTDVAAADIRRRAIPNGANGFDVIAVELVIFTSDASTWTLALTDSATSAAPNGWRDVTVAGISDASSPARTAVEVSAAIPSGSTGLLQLSSSGTSTITRGYIAVTVRYDRARSTGNSHASYDPTLLYASDPDAVAPFNTEFTSEQDAVARDLANNRDVRIDSFCGLGLSNASAAALRVWNLPSSGRTILKIVAHGIADTGISAAFDVTINGNSTLNAMTVAGAGPGTSGIPATSTYTPGSPVVQTDDPTDDSDDTTFNVTITGGTFSWLTVHVVSI